MKFDKFIKFGNFKFLKFICIFILIFGVIKSNGVDMNNGNKNRFPIKKDITLNKKNKNGENNVLNNFDKISDTSTKLSNQNSNKNTSTLPLNLNSPHYSSLNKTFVIKDMRTFKDEHNEWDYKLLSRQLEEIFSLFLYKNNKDITPESTRAIIKLFVDNFEKCDTNKDNVLNLIEFQACVKSNKYFKLFNLHTQQPKFMTKLLDDNKKWTNISDTDSLAERIFNSIDESGNNYLNFYDFMMLRLISFAWRKCGNIGFFIDEVNFECAFEIAAKTKTLNRNSAKTLYKLGIELSNFQSVRYLDLVTFITLSMTGKLYGKINTKEDGDITTSEFNLALDASILPLRYNRDVINAFYKLIQQADMTKSGLDMFTFIFLDNLLKMFKIDRTGRDESCITYGDFTTIINDFQFPKKIIQEFYYLPYFNLTNDNYRKFMQVNTSKYFEEKDFLLRKMRFKSSRSIRSGEKTKKLKSKRLSGKLSNSNSSSNDTTATETTYTTTTTEITNNTTTDSLEGNMTFKSLDDKLKWINKKNENYAKDSSYYMLNPKLYNQFNFTFTSGNIFHLMDFPQKNCVSFENFAFFMQIAYLFKEFDKDKKGKLTALSLYEQFQSYSNYPKVSNRIYERVNNFRLITDGTYIDLFYTYALLRVDDIVNRYSEQDYYGVSVKELNIKLILERINIKEYPDELMRSCIKGFDDHSRNIKLPQYDWTCVISKAVQSVCNYLEHLENSKIVELNNIKLVNTQFNNYKK